MAVNRDYLKATGKDREQLSEDDKYFRRCYEQSETPMSASYSSRRTRAKARRRNKNFKQGHELDENKPKRRRKTTPMVTETSSPAEILAALEAVQAQLRAMGVREEDL